MKVYVDVWSIPNVGRHKLHFVDPPVASDFDPDHVEEIVGVYERELVSKPQRTSAHWVDLPWSGNSWGRWCRWNSTSLHLPCAWQGLKTGPGGCLWSSRLCTFPWSTCHTTGRIGGPGLKCLLSVLVQSTFLQVYFLGV